MQRPLCSWVMVVVVTQASLSLPQPKCTCLHMKDLRDLAPLYPTVRNELARMVTVWREVEARIGVGKEVRFSLLSINMLANL